MLRIRELTVSGEDKENENQDLKDNVASLQAELESVRSDCQGILKVMSSMEKQLSEYSAREESTVQVRRMKNNVPSKPA